MKKATVLAFTMVFLLGMSVSSALAWHAETPTLWWTVYDSQPDVENPMAGISPTTEVTLTPGDTLYAGLFVSGIPTDDELGLGAFEVFTAWDDGQFGSPYIHVSDALWPFFGQKEITGPPFEGEGAVNLGQPTYSGDDIALYVINLTCTDFGEDTFEWVHHNLIKPGGTSYILDFTSQVLTVSNVPIPGAVLLLGSGLLGLVGIGARRKRHAA